MPRLSRHHLRFLVLEQVLGAAIINFVLNAGIAWVGFRRLEVVPIWGWVSVSVDTLSTAFVLPIITALSAHVLVRQQVRRKLLPRLSNLPQTPSVWERRSSFRRGVLLGVASLVFGAVPVLSWFACFGPAQMTVSQFVWFKAGFAAALGAVVTPWLGWWALENASRDAR